MKGCINIISSRKLCIEHCLRSLWEGYNHKHEYPTYVYYFDDIYDDLSFQKQIKESISQNIHFVSVPYRTPDFIDESDMFYNRQDISYVRNSFSINRKGYLHMCNFTSNMYGYENTELEKYDFIMTHDDESGYDKLMPYDPFDVLEQEGYQIGAFFVGQRLKNGQPHQGHLDTRVGLWDFTKRFLIDNDIDPKSKSLADLLVDSQAHNNFHFLEWCDTYVIKNTAFQTDLWKKWISAVNKSGGIYKYRWGDNEIISLFAHMLQDKIYNFGAVRDGIHNQGKFRYLQDYAPGVRDLSR